MKRDRGYTLVEILVALGLAGLVVVAALQMYRAFDRQGLRQLQVAEMQQSLRVADEVIARSVRGAGAALAGGALDVNTCGGRFSYFPLQFSSSNTYADPLVLFDTDPNNTDGDPDWLRVTGARADDLVRAVDRTGDTITVCDVSRFTAGDGIVIVSTDTNLATRVSCQRLVTNVNPRAVPECGTSPTPGDLRITAPGDANCANPATAVDACIQAIAFPTTIYRVSTQSAVFRVDETTDPGTPRLMVSYAPPGQPPVWRVLAENVEDFQVALVLDDGTVCGAAGRSIDDPAQCNLLRVRAVRYTLVVRSSSDIPGFNLGVGGNIEDRPAAANDGFLRRSITSIVDLRNMP